MRSSLVFLVFAFLHTGLAGAGMSTELAEAAKLGGIAAGDLAAAEKQAVAWIYERESRDRQVTVLALVRIPAAPQTITDDLLDSNGIVQSEALREIGVFSNPPTAQDVAKYRVPESDLEALVDCEVGDCKFKLGERGVQKLREIDWSRPDTRERIDAMMHEGMIQFVQRYEKQGRDALFATVDKEEPLDFGEGSDRLTAQLGLSKELVPALDDHMLHYPNTGIEGARDRIVWSVRDYGYRPVTSVVHSIIYQPSEGHPDTLIVLKTLYASHYFHARQQMFVLFADTENPSVTWVGYSDRMLFDGDIGSIKRRMLQSGVVTDTKERLDTLRKAYR